VTEVTQDDEPGGTEMDDETAALIPRRAFFDNPDRAFVGLSPNGEHISYLAPLDGVMNVWVAPRENLDAARPVTSDTGQGVCSWCPPDWAHTNAHILYMQDERGDENEHLYVVDLETGAVKDLTPFDGVQAGVQHGSSRHPSDILVSINNRNPQFRDMYKVDIRTGAMTLALQNDGFGVGYRPFITDDDLRTRLAMRTTSDGGIEICEPSGDGWDVWATIPAEDSETTTPLGFDGSGDILFMKESRGRNTAAVVARHLPTDTTTVLAEDSMADPADVLLHPTEKHVQAVSFVYERKRWQIIDESIEPDMAYLRTVVDGDVEIVSRALDDRYWIVQYVVDDGPARFYLYDRKERRARFLFSNRKDLDGRPLAKMHSTVIESRDGLSMVAYHTLPPGSDSNGDGIPDTPLPTVLLPHGGPFLARFLGIQPRASVACEPWLRRALGELPRIHRPWQGIRECRRPPMGWEDPGGSG